MVGRKDQGSRRRELQERDRRRREEEQGREREREETTRREAQQRESREAAAAAAVDARDKEKGKGKEGEKEKVNDGESGKFGQQFARVFLSQLYGDRLKIPPSFSQYLQNQPTGVVSLKGPSGNIWLAELASDTEGLFFVKGWKEFVRDHSIEMGHFLTFRYDGHSQFSVAIFDGMCIEKPSAFHAKPCKDLVVKLESSKGDMDINAAGPSQVSAAPLEESNETTRNAITEMDANGSTSKKPFSILESSMPEASAVTCKVAPTNLNMDMNAAGPPEAVVPPLEESNQTTRKRVREIDANGSALQKSSIASDKDKKMCPAASVGTYRTSTSLNSTEDSDSSSSMLEQSISCIKSELSSPIRNRMSKDVATRGKNSVEGQRQLKVISQRPLITEEQKNRALLRANQFKSKNHFTLQIMKESYVYVGFFLKLPCDFVRECLPRANTKLKLWNPQGKSWDVNYVYNSNRTSGAFSGGWGKFSLANNLEKFDVCVFELFSKDNIKVHIYRVLPEITPFLPGHNRK